MTPARKLPDWLRDKPGSEAIRPAAGAERAAEKLCQVCGEPWAPRHPCKGAETEKNDFNRPVATKREQTMCEVCGKVKRSNHACKGKKQTDPAGETAKQCEHCEASGELCVRHGGMWTDYEASRGVDERVAKTLPAPVPVMQSEITHMCRKGHPRTPENTYIRSDGRRECKECKRYYQNTGRPALPAEADRELAAIGTILKAVEGLASNQLKRVMSYVAARIEEAE